MNKINSSKSHNLSEKCSQTGLVQGDREREREAGIRESYRERQKGREGTGTASFPAPCQLIKNELVAAQS